MLEKNKSKRPFIIDIFKFFPHNNFKLRNDIDITNFDAYLEFKEGLERKRAIDGNKLEIQNEFKILKSRL
jgi:hypothetical protein